MLCQDPCLQNKIGFEPINSDKIKEATVHGRIIFYLPKKIRLNSERQLFTLGKNGVMIPILTLHLISNIAY